MESGVRGDKCVDMDVFVCACLFVFVCMRVFVCVRVCGYVCMSLWLCVFTCDHVSYGFKKLPNIKSDKGALWLEPTNKSKDIKKKVKYSEKSR